MNRKLLPIILTFIWLQAILCIGGGVIYIVVTPDNAHDDLNTSIVKLFLFLNLIFFSVTILLGTVSLVVIRKANYLPLSIILSAGLGIASILVSGLASSTFGIIAVFIPIAGFIFGFYLPVRNQIYTATTSENESSSTNIAENGS
jgi:hypothetical protein